MIKRFLIFLLCIITLTVSVPYVSAASPEIHSIQGERTVFASAFGKLTYDGTNYVSFRNISDAVDALGDLGGVILALGTFDMSKFNDKPGRGTVTIRGAGAKASETVLNYPSGTEKVSFASHTRLRNLVIKTQPDVPIVSNGYVLDIGSTVECDFKETYVKNGDNIITYTAPFVVASGDTLERKADAILLSGGHYKAVAGGSVMGDASLDTSIVIDGGIYEGVYGGNFSCNGKFVGSSKIEISDGEITNLVAAGDSGSFEGDVNIILSGGAVETLTVGSVGGLHNGNIQIALEDGNVGRLVIGSTNKSLKINGNVVLRITGADISRYDTSNASTITGEKIYIVKDASAKMALEKENFDYLITEIGTTVKPVFDRNELVGFEIYDENGFVPVKMFANGKQIFAQDGLFKLPKGKTEVSCEPFNAIAINKEASVVRGYEDGSFRPQNDMTIAEAITLLARIITPDLSALSQFARTDITDVHEDSWYYGQVAFFDTLGFVDKFKADDSNTIGPNLPVTRAQFCELAYHVLSMLYDIEGVTTKNFKDVYEDNVYADAIGKLGYYGIVGGYEDGTFRPDNRITRAEVVTVVNRMLGRVSAGGSSGKSFYDAVGHWAESQIITACNPSVIDGLTVWTLEDDITVGSFDILQGSVTVGDQIRNLYNSYSTGPVSSNDVIDGIDKISKWQIDNIVNAPSEYHAERRTYYISNNGNDINDGLSPQTAWATLTKLKNTMLLPGDVVLFERGSIFRGNIRCMSGVTYSAYGVGEKPIISGSYENYADPSIWVETDVPNVYKLQRNVYNVGVMVFNDTGKLGNYNEMVGALRVIGLDGFTGYHDLSEDLTFVSNLYTNELYLYSIYGNPGERFNSIEIGQYHHLMSVDGTHDVVIDNIRIRHTGGHGITGGFLRNVTVRNCVADYMGGSILKGYGATNTVRVGNSLQVYGGCDGWYCYNNWCYQIYDTGVTHQFNSPYDKKDCYMDNVRYIGNVFEYCHWAIEWYNYDHATTEHTFYNTYIADNICRMTGYGWGSRHRPTGAATMCSWGLTRNTRNFVAENNIFDRSLGDTFYVNGEGNKKLELKNNIYVQDLGGALGYIYGIRYYVPEDISRYMKDLLKDTTGIFIFSEDTDIVNYKPNRNWI